VTIQYIAQPYGLFGRLAEEPKPNGWPADYEKQFWDRYPRKVAKADAMRRLTKVKKIGVSFQRILDGIDRYIAWHDDPTAKWRPDYAYPATWLHDGRWDDEYPVGESNGQRSASERAFDKAREAAIRERG